MRKTLEVYIADRDELWPEHFQSRVAHRRQESVGAGAPDSDGLSNDGAVQERHILADGLLPPAWQYLGKDGNITNRRAGPIGEFYETGDSADGLIYRIGSAQSLFVRREIERFRRGRPAAEADQPRRTNGHLWWRFNGTWPLIDSELVDYLLEPKIAYYAFARAQLPILLSFEIGDRITLWITNDTGFSETGIVVISLIHMETGEAVHRMECEVDAKPGDSFPVTNLDAFGMFRRDLVLHAEMRLADGRVITRASDFADEERNIVFPDPRLDISQVAPDRLLIQTDCFARSVHLEGQAPGETNLPAIDGFHQRDPQGDRFGWRFSDNYFDLLPGESKMIRLLGRHRSGTVRAKSFFSEKSTSLELTANL
jgi:hypothetical protein